MTKKNITKNILKKKEKNLKESQPENIEDQIKQLTLKINNRAIEQEIWEKNKKNYLNAIMIKVLVDLIILMFYFVGLLFSPNYLQEEVLIMNVLSVCTRLTCQFFLLIIAGKQKTPKYSLYFYITMQTFYALHSTSNSKYGEFHTFLVHLSEFDGWLLVLRYRKRFTSIVIYTIYFTLVKFYCTFQSRKIFDYYMFLLPLIMLYKEYIDQKNRKSTEIENCLKINNLKTQIEVTEYLPTGLCIVDSDCIHFHNERIKLILGIRQAQQIFEKFDKVKLDLNKIFLAPPESQTFDSTVIGYLEKTSLTETLKKNIFSENSEKSKIEIEQEEDNSNLVTMNEFIKKILTWKNHKDCTNFIIPNVVMGKRVYEIFLDPILYKNKTCYLVGIIDVSTKNKKMYLEDANLYKDKILAYISHNLRTPLNGIMDYLNRKNKEKKSGNSGYRKIAVECADNLLDLTENIKTFTEISNGELKLQKKPLNLRTFLKRFKKKFSKICQDRGIQLEIDDRKYENSVVFTSKEKLSQILSHLIRNSIKFTCKGYIRIKVENIEENIVRLKIEDTGVGIGPEKLRMIKETIDNPLSLPMSVKEDKEPFGLGLIICSHLTNILAPEDNPMPFLIRSEEDMGTEVEIYLDVSKKDFLPQENFEESYIKSFLKRKSHPFNSEAEASPIMIEERINSKSNGNNNLTTLRKDKKFQKLLMNSPLQKKKQFLQAVNTQMKGLINRRNHSNNFKVVETLDYNEECDCYDILVVDDSDLILNFLVKFLKEEGNYSTHKAFNGKLAIDNLTSKCGQGHFHYNRCKMIITDINMPIINGRELAKLIKEKIQKGEIPFTPIVANTANVVENKKDYQEFDDVFGKPVKRKEVLECVNALVKHSDMVRKKGKNKS